MSASPCDIIRGVNQRLGGILRTGSMPPGATGAGVGVESLEKGGWTCNGESIQMQNKNKNIKQKDIPLSGSIR